MYHKSGWVYNNGKIGGFPSRFLVNCRETGKCRQMYLRIDFWTGLISLLKLSLSLSVTKLNARLFDTSTQSNRYVTSSNQWLEKCVRAKGARYLLRVKICGLVRWNVLSKNLKLSVSELSQYLSGYKPEKYEKVVLFNFYLLEWKWILARPKREKRYRIL